MVHPTTSDDDKEPRKQMSKTEPLVFSIAALQKAIMLPSDLEIERAKAGR